MKRPHSYFAFRCIVCCLFVIGSFSAFARKIPVCKDKNPTDSIIESKVDYLEKIYFSGSNKEDMTNSIMIALQQMEQAISNKTASAAVIAQYTFLNEIKDKVAIAKDACAVTDMLAAGIYNLDVSQAVAQNVPRPSQKTTLDLTSVITKTQNASASSSLLAYNTLLLSKGKVNGSGLASSVGSAASTLGSTLQTGKQLSDLAGGLGGLLKKKDKGCKSVPEKVIAISNHPSAAPEKIIVETKTTQTITNDNSTASSDKKTTITISGADYAKLSKMEQNIKTCATVKSTQKRFNTGQSTIEVIHTGSTDDLVQLMLQTCKDNFKMENIVKSEEGIVAINLSGSEGKKTK